MKKIMNIIKTSIWLYPAVYGLVALILAFGITIFQRQYADQLDMHVNDLFYTSTDLAQKVLGIVAGAFITISTFTFSTTMVVLTMYSSQFTPRVVENFLNNKVTMKSFGVFLSGFIYSITSLLFTQSSEESNLVIGASVGVVYVIIGLIYFLLFIHNVATHIQASDLILRLQDEALHKIRSYRDFIIESEVISESAMQQLIDQKKTDVLCAAMDGYIQEINYQHLQKIAQDHNLILGFKKVVGQFVSTETEMLLIYQQGENEEDIDDATLNAIHRSVLIGNKRTQTQDFSFSIQKIVEIALKALSPGVNDPNTAIHCLNIIGVLLRDLAEIEKGFVVFKNEDEQGHVLYEAFDFEVLLYDAYNQIGFYGQADAAVVKAEFKSLRLIKAKASQKNTEIIEVFAKHLFNKCSEKRFDPLEYKTIKKEYEDFLAN